MRVDRQPTVTVDASWKVLPLFATTTTTTKITTTNTDLFLLLLLLLLFLLSTQLIDEFNLAELKKLKVEAPKSSEVEDLEWCGYLDTYNDEYDRLRAKPKPLDFSEKVIFFFVNTVDVRTTRMWW